MAIRTRKAQPSGRSAKRTTSVPKKASTLKLSERITANTSKAKKSKNATTEKKDALGYLTMNGKLVNANDIGVKLRMAGKQPAASQDPKASPAKTKTKKATAVTTASKRQAVTNSQQTRIKKSLNAIASKNLPGNARRSKNIITTTSSGRRTRTINPKSIRQAITNNRTRVAEVIKKRVTKNTRNKDQYFKAGSNYNQLIINTDIDNSDKILIFYNLALGIKQDSLKQIIERLSGISIKKVRVKDLATGSSTAQVWLSNPNIPDLEKIRTQFDSALVDGRTIQVLLSSESTRTLVY
ncbi:hypothetical protein TPHA_0F02010 [Tetrapisispora phaffii CBS 4417]|uniref:Uncharacterized protein n=1 Tax=Tetrapisispora phaffii (strain ATCC 24235 / CBS 4417 / NBRC 1672 / NRRL Y-8282 / UCD 70-5) TaxID=1071381 RepID=G8BVA1_TETPH|nr:hypothetical protein TPHA_0F02010 [Tetrapisispora phaffii CBS 4417]CCE63683.1 hypothetical protein TPHA_0F02010 [Tetrapisispora phaffii CBS 4417]